ncbi:hypothetical protein ACFQVA_15275 [Actinomadura keratinilytica]
MRERHPGRAGPGPHQERLRAADPRHLPARRRRGHRGRRHLQDGRRGRQGEGGDQRQRRLAGREGVPTFCRTTVCRSTANAYGRYVYFTVGGFTNGDNVTKQDRAVFTTGDDVAEFTLRQIHRRGVAQASQAAAAQ